jgi:hypothetical protein
MIIKGKTKNWKNLFHCYLGEQEPRLAPETEAVSPGKKPESS